MKQHLFRTFGAITALAVALPVAAQETGAERDRSERYGEGNGRTQLEPYIEASQILLAELSPGDEVVTYTQVAVGVDATIAGRNNAASVSVRYERNFAYSDDIADSDTVSGVARGYASIVPQALSIEAGALAARTRVDGNGGASLGPLAPTEAESRVYSAYAGPNLHTRAGDVEVNANYRIGYTRVEAPDVVVTSPGAEPVDVFEDSTVHSANVHLGTRPGDPLPVGLGVGGGYYREDISNLDQRVEDAHVRADVTVPLGPSVAVVGGIGYEDVEISSRDVLRDAAGNPVIGADGRLVTDESAPRQLAYDVSGIIWDVGVMWRPSSRTALEAHVGRRYDSTTYYGSFAWAPDSRRSVNISAYDGVTGFGGLLNRALVALPTEFEATRNALTGDLGGCVAGTQGANCLTGVLGSVRSATFRGRGIAATYSERVGRMSGGVGVGYDRRSFIAAPNTILASANGVVDENYWLALFVNGDIGQRAGFSVNAYANWLKSGFANAGDATILGASAAYRQHVAAGLSARAAIALDYLDSDVVGEDLKTASALLGLRYDF